MKTYTFVERNAETAARATRYMFIVQWCQAGIKMASAESGEAAPKPGNISYSIDELRCFTGTTQTVLASIRLAEIGRIGTARQLTRRERHTAEPCPDPLETFLPERHRQVSAPWARYRSPCGSSRHVSTP